ncbi:hypothetical protein BS47DRAFT_580455 [Hydnum rufescens UP504]|uniref:LIM zinc-binding domain-containing protein n=1 Tax=Hydnum rufescens UP504 TaxID=1448309 RepID=A0A9P6DI03_9AGAM|nr:hypothetical protein BS47DRAFT_580455 [Hydnum rufescens UP504]
MDLTCFSCRRPLEDAHVSRGGQNYHPHHFKCRECPLPFNPQDAIFWHDNLLYCRFHYSTRFAPKCAGCTTAVFSQHIAFGGEDECWHFECYLLNVLWSIKLAPPGRQIKSAIPLVSMP